MAKTERKQQFGAENPTKWRNQLEAQMMTQEEYDKKMKKWEARQKLKQEAKEKASDKKSWFQRMME